MDHRVWRLVLFCSYAHALVHVYELSLPSVEQEIAAHYAATMSTELSPMSAEGAAAGDVNGKRMTGWLSFAWRFPFGFGALLAGWLVDRWGSRRMLTLYLLGCGGMCLLAATAPPLPWLFVIMFCMGAFACIYHPAGLTLISRETHVGDLTRAMGVHGVFGSAGIAAAPFLLGGILALGGTWQWFYAVLAVPGIALAIAGPWLADESRRGDRLGSNTTPSAPTDPPNWPAFALLTSITCLQGMVYAGVMCFLRRFLSGDDPSPAMLAMASHATGAVLMLGCIGQYAAARFARPGRMELQLMQVILGNAPLLVWMSLADSLASRMAAAACFSIVHFMYQPLYNSLVAHYTPLARRSASYGFSFAMSFGLGGLGAPLVGMMNLRQAYLMLAGLAIVSSMLCLVLGRIARNGRSAHQDEPPADEPPAEDPPLDAPLAEDPPPDRRRP